MLGRLIPLFHRYAAKHTRLRQRHGPVQMRLQAGRMIVEIDSDAEAAQVSLGKATRQARRRDGLLRAELPFVPGARGTVVLRRGEDTVTLPFGPFAAWKNTAARTALLAPFVTTGVRAVPPALRWFRDRDPAARITVRNLFGLAPTTTALELQTPLFAAGTAPDPQSGITIVLPVYNAFDMLQEALERVERHTDLPWRLILIEDASPDPQVRPWLRDWAADRDDVTLLENERNLGFIGSVNRGLTLAMEYGDPVVLLNSDAFVPQGWASRLIAPLADPAVASVTPMSNDAELMSVPVLCQRLDLAQGQGDAIDAVARTLAAPTEEADLPTGVGFCMALAADWLERVGLFDTDFGRGYGEEVDWCRRALAMGARHLAQPALFVEHRGGTSFGSEEKQRLLLANSAILSQRYPTFDQDVQDFIGSDPLLAPRLALALAWAGQRGRVRIYLAHDMGGGAEADLQRRIAGDGVAVVLRVGSAYRWEIEVYTPNGVVRGGTEDSALTRRLLQILPQREVIYSCAVGDPDPVQIPAFLSEIAEGQGMRVLLHDYFPISPAYTLLDGQGMFRGVPQPGAEGRVDRLRRPDGSRLSLADWQAVWGPFLAASETVEVFSEAAARLLRSAYPDLHNITVAPHQLVHPVLPVTAPEGPPVIGVLGNINAHKGADVVTALSRRLKRGQMVVIGRMAPGHRLGRGGIEHGPYDVSEIPDLVARYGITCWLVPSIWPETFSFTTHEALATGLPTFAFDLGAQGDAVRNAANGHPIEPGADIDRVVAHLLEPRKEDVT